MASGVDAAERATTPGGEPIMTAKFLVPAVKGPVVARPRLLERLSTGVLGPLTLVSAPAGSGKTVLASTWATSGAALGPVVWISLDEEDDLPGVLWSYVLAGLLNLGVDVSAVTPPERLDTDGGLRRGAFSLGISVGSQDRIGVVASSPGDVSRIDEASVYGLSTREPNHRRR